MKRRGWLLNYFLFLSSIIILAGTSIKLSATEILPPDLEALKQEGQLFTIRITRGQPIRIFVVGREEAKLDLSQLKLTVRRLKPYPGQTLSVSKTGDYFTITEPIEKAEDLEITTKIKEKSEKFHFNLKQHKN